MDRGLLVNCTQGNIVRLLPAMVLTDELAAEGCDILADVIKNQTP
jgi:acetylornithine/N-succinyldiaminopimelate aminotransferase